MRRALLPLLLALALAGCDRPQKTADQVRDEIAAYKASPSDAGQARIEADLAKLDGQIARLESRGQTADAATCRARAENLRSDYRAARMVRAMQDAQSAIHDLGSAFQQAGQSLGDAFRKPAATPNP